MFSKNLAHDLADGLRAFAAVLLRDLEHHALGFVEELLVVAEFPVGSRLDLGARGDQAAQGGFFLHQACVVPDVLGGGDGIGQLDEVGLAVLQAGERTAVLELIAQGNYVDGLAPFVELQHGREDLAVGGQQEIVGRDGGRHLVEGRGLDQDAAQRRALGFQAMRRLPPRCEREDRRWEFGHGR